MTRIWLLKLCKNIATLGNIGYLPAPGTCATLVTLPVVVLIKQYVSLQVEMLLLIGATVVSLLIIACALPLFPHPFHASDTRELHDPSHIVLDEMVGCLWAFYGATVSWRLLFAGFFLFRFFDIVKPCGIHRLQYLPGAWGIVADDLLAALYTALILYNI